MLPKIKAILEALTYGVPQVHVVKAKTEAMLEELFTRTGSGTLIEKEPFLEPVFPSQSEHLEDILQLRKECSKYKTPSGTASLLKPLEPDDIEELLPTTLTLWHRDVLVGTVFFSELENHPDTAIIGGFAVGENHHRSGYGKTLINCILEQVEESDHPHFKKAISITASPAVKSLYEQLGAQDISTYLPDVLEAAKERYKEDGHLVKIYLFNN